MLIEFISAKYKNFLSYGNNVTEFHFKKGLTLITATNGSGKSGIIDVVTFCLFGKPYRKIKIDELINDINCNKLWTEIIFIKGEEKYKIERGLKPAILKVFKTNKNKEFTKEDELDSLSHKSLIQDEIDKIIGVNYNLFKQIISLSLLYNKPFLTLDPHEKRDISESIFNIKVFGKMLKTLKKNNTVLNSTLELKNKEFGLMKENLQGLYNQINSLNKAKENFELDKATSIKELQDVQIKLRSDFDIILSEISSIDLTEPEVNTKLKEKLYLDLDSESDNLIDLSGKKRELESKLKGVGPDSKIEDSICAERKNVLQQEIKIEETKIDNLNKERNGTLNKSFLMKNVQDYIDINNKITDFKITIKNLKDDINNLKLGTGTCQYCLQIISEEHKDEEIKKREAQIEDLENNISKLEKDMSSSIEKHISETSSQINAQILKCNELVSEKTLEIGKIIADNIKNTITKYQLQIDLLAESLENITKKQKNLKLEISKIDELEKVARENKSKYEKLKIQSQNAKEKIANNIESIEKEKAKNFSIDIEPVQSDFDKRKKNYQELNAKIKLLEKEVKVSEVVKNILDEGGIKKYFFSRLIPKLNESINNFLDYFELPIQFQFDDMFQETIKVFHKERSYFNFSGGEQFRINLSIILSFMELNMMINSFNCNILFFDEIFDTGVDDVGMELVLEKIHAMVEKNNNVCYIISHRAIENSMHIDNVIKIKKVKGFSKIIV